MQVLSNHNLCQEIHVATYNSKDINYAVSLAIAHLLVERGVVPSNIAETHLRLNKYNREIVFAYTPRLDCLWLVSYNMPTPLSEDMQASLALMPNHEARLTLLNM